MGVSWLHICNRTVIIKTGVSPFLMQMEPRPKVKAPEPPVRTTQATPTSKSGRNLVSEERLELDDLGGEHQMQANSPTYLKELVVVSVLLALCVSVLLTIALFSFRQRCRRTAPDSTASQRSGGASPHEREALRGTSPRGSKRNGHAQNAAKPPDSLSNGMLNGSNGHLPNTPI